MAHPAGNVTPSAATPLGPPPPQASGHTPFADAASASAAAAPFVASAAAATATDSAVQQSIAASSSSSTHVVLRNWSLKVDVGKTCNGQTKPPSLLLSGLVHGKDARQTSVVVQRYSERHVVAQDGSMYQLHGELDTLRCLAAGQSRSFCATFSRGLPGDWRERVQAEADRRVQVKKIVNWSLTLIPQRIAKLGLSSWVGLDGVADEFDGVYLRSNAITSSSSYRFVSAVTQEEFELVGKPDVAAMVRNGFSSSFSESFAHGFPADWQTAIAEEVKRIASQAQEKRDGGVTEPEDVAASASTKEQIASERPPMQPATRVDAGTSTTPENLLAVPAPILLTAPAGPSIGTTDALVEPPQTATAPSVPFSAVKLCASGDPTAEQFSQWKLLRFTHLCTCLANIEAVYRGNIKGKVERDFAHPEDKLASPLDLRASVSIHLGGLRVATGVVSALEEVALATRDTAALGIQYAVDAPASKQPVFVELCGALRREAELALAERTKLAPAEEADAAEQGKEAKVGKGKKKAATKAKAESKEAADGEEEQGPSVGKVKKKRTTKAQAESKEAADGEEEQETSVGKLKKKRTTKAQTKATSKASANPEIASGSSKATPAKKLDKLATKRKKAVIDESDDEDETTDLPINPSKKRRNKAQSAQDDEEFLAADGPSTSARPSAYPKSARKQAQTAATFMQQIDDYRNQLPDDQ